MGQRFQVKPVKKYKAGYPKKGFFRRSFVSTVPLKLFSFFVVGLLFFITVPGCNEEELSGYPLTDYDIETTDVDTAEKLDDVNPDDDILALDDDIVPDVEKNDFDELDGLPQPECTTDEECDEGYYCDMNSNTCVMELGGEAVPECETDEDCAEGFYCDQTTFTCEEEMLGDPVPDQMPDEDSVVNDETADQDINDSEEIPDEELGGIAPPELRK